MFQELAPPKADTPNFGYLIPNVELSPLCSPKFRPGPPSDQAQVASKMIDDILANSATLDLKELCICKDKLVWALYCDLICIDYDGSVTDACIGALIAALKTCENLKKKKTMQIIFFQILLSELSFFFFFSHSNFTGCSI